MTENSAIVGTVASLRDRTANAFDESQIIGVARAVATTTAAFVRGSGLYQWLTAEPDPEVVVINLRETYTVGPFIAILDRLIETLAPSYRESQLADAVDALTALLERAADTRAGRVLGALFEPPEPPTDAGNETTTPTAHDEDAPEADTPDRD